MARHAALRSGGKYITGDVDYKEKFLKYAEILPNLAGNPLYYWTHMELKQIFDIHEPLNENNALRLSLIHISEPTRPY